jgi:FAD/FMN-containing dehydrogenase
MLPKSASRDVNRREFLALCGLGILPAVNVACGSSQAGVPSKSPATPHPTLTPPTPSPTPQPPLTSKDWLNLASNLKGTLLRPGDAAYQNSYHPYNTRFDAIHPAAIAYCTSVADIQTCLSFVTRFQLPLAMRAGGHSYAGYSTSSGFVLDVTRMNAVTVDPLTGAVVVGAGARLIDVYSALAQHGLALPAGSCATVGIAGLTLGGGVGVLGRKFGLTCDNLLSVQLVLADHRVLTCDANHNADLFWALRGGGGGNFGVVTSFTFRAHPVTTLSLFTLRWPWSEAAQVIDAWQRWAPQAPDELWSNCLLETTGNVQESAAIQVGGVYVGSVGPLNTLLQQLINQVPVAPTSRYAGSTDVLDAMLDEAGCYGRTVSQCHLPGQTADGQLQRDSDTYRSDYYTQPLSRQGIMALINTINTRQSSSAPGAGAIGLDAYGGAMNRVAANATAFVHRNALFSAQYSVNGNTGWLNDTWQAMRPYASGEAYQNYIDPNLPNWQQAYYGANYQRLQQIKALYDPQDFFHFKQGIAV